MIQLEIRCSRCNALLLKAQGDGTQIEVKCQRCGAVVTWPKQRPQTRGARVIRRVTNG